MGNARKPDNVHLLQGTHQKCRHGDPADKPQVKIEVPDAPGYLSGIAKIEWEYICNTLKNSALLSKADITILAMYCELYAEFQIDPREFTAAKYTQLRLCLVELGLTPKARSQITVGKKPDSNPFDDS